MLNHQQYSIGWRIKANITYRNNDNQKNRNNRNSRKEISNKNK